MIFILTTSVEAWELRELQAGAAKRYGISHQPTDNNTCRGELVSRRCEWLREFWRLGVSRCMQARDWFDLAVLHVRPARRRRRRPRRSQEDQQQTNTNTEYGCDHLRAVQDISSMIHLQQTVACELVHYYQ